MAMVKCQLGHAVFPGGLNVYVKIIWFLQVGIHWDATTNRTLVETSSFQLKHNVINLTDRFILQEEFPRFRFVISRILSSWPNRLYGSLKNILKIGNKTPDSPGGIMEQQCHHPLGLWKRLTEIDLVPILFKVRVLIQAILNGKCHYPD